MSNACTERQRRESVRTTEFLNFSGIVKIRQIFVLGQTPRWSRVHPMGAWPGAIFLSINKNNFFSFPSPFLSVCSFLYIFILRSFLFSLGGRGMYILKYFKIVIFKRIFLTVCSISCIFLSIYFFWSGGII